MGGSLVKTQSDCLQKEALTSEIQAVWVVFASLVGQNRVFDFIGQVQLTKSRRALATWYVKKAQMCLYNSMLLSCRWLVGNKTGIDLCTHVIVRVWY